eukprot:SAG11_NODE_22762_length_400_cov_1.574751_1_plen_62_part_01
MGFQNFCQTFRAKKSIDTESQKLLRPVLESGLSGPSYAVQLYGRTFFPMQSSITTILLVGKY